MNQAFLDTARLLTQVAPVVFESGLFALKGGTAINLFMRELPRLSVDLDLVLVDHSVPRDRALGLINDAFKTAAARLEGRGLQTHMIAPPGLGETKLLVRSGAIEVKVEVNVVMRGTVHPVSDVALSETASELLMAELELPLVSLADAYGGKLVASLDRQHPRDLFDVIQLLQHEGITPDIRRSFVVYLASHNRPVHEVLSPKLRDIQQDYEHTFVGMTREPVALEELLGAREHVIRELVASLDDAERKFLLSLVRNTPDWGLLGIEHLEALPGIRWKLHNLERLAAKDTRRFTEQFELLECLLA
ncbi:MAG: nucleotidyl transferase AbiEii/AbiGii toxin family protein [Candidatus Thiodiazotropha sp.]